MPVTFVGLLLFVVALAPGMSFLLVLERRLPSRQLSAFRETVSITAVGLACDAAVLGFFTAARIIFPQVTPDVGALIRDPGATFRTDYAEFGAWGASLLVLACALGAVLGRYWRADAFSESSGWWAMFETAYREAPEARSLLVTCELSDGTLVAGALRSWNTDSRDHPDRDLVLQAPIYRRSKGRGGGGGATAQRIPDLGLLAVNGRNIITVGVAFLSTDLADETAAPAPISIRVPAAAEADAASSPGGSCPAIESARVYGRRPWSRRKVPG